MRLDIRIINRLARKLGLVVTPASRLRIYQAEVTLLGQAARDPSTDIITRARLAGRAEAAERHLELHDYEIPDLKDRK